MTLHQCWFVILLMAGEWVPGNGVKKIGVRGVQKLGNLGFTWTNSLDIQFLGDSACPIFSPTGTATVNLWICTFACSASFLISTFVFIFSRRIRHIPVSMSDLVKKLMKGNRLCDKTRIRQSRADPRIPFYLVDHQV